MKVKTLPMNVKAFNPGRLDMALKYNGCTIKDLSEKINHPRQTLSAYKNGKEGNPNPYIIQKISETLGFPLSFFYEEDKNLVIGSTYFRALLTTKRNYRDQQILKMALLSHVYTLLNQYINFPIFEPVNFLSATTPEKAAIQLREYWSLGNRPIENIVYTVEGKGIPITTFEMPTDAIDAFSQMIDIDNKSLYLIGFSSNKTSAARIHFDVAHELGHIMLHEWDEDIEELEKADFKEREKEANEFASAFLLPADSFSLDIMNRNLTIPYYTQLKAKWKVSIAAMSRRAWSLGITSYDEYQNMMRLLQRRGLRKDEPLDDTLVTSKPTLLRTAVQMLLDEKIFTPKELVDELAYSCNLSLDAIIIENLLNLPKNTLSEKAPIHHLRLIKK